MATIVTCDACRKVIPLGSNHFFDVPLHIKEGPQGYVDGAGEEISGRFVRYDLCLPCYNKIHSSAYSALLSICVVSNFKEGEI